MKVFKGITVRIANNGCGIDKLCPTTGVWSIMFTSLLSKEDNQTLWALFD